ncbi:MULTISPECIES: YkyA family protein [Staphylococcus]|uniref:Lipoprotein n=4 Tax=Staphylococcus aureus TaxID=1280 RepID=A0AAE8TK88_STAAU|nr:MULTISPECIES: YkyA family protein [Staphylococcus]HDH6200531.1 YkyA family protein [Staphylococcus aureus LTCF-15-62]HDH6209317.1 YkyA family protein [Staphylococcus aureus LTCF-14-59]HDH6280933.1 YkyA family protein [Staphylococcus aureus LTCF-3-23]HDH6492547.1 YkyA family protein [Staphylococcus aureus MRSA-Lux-7]HDK8312077.1 YkyA family protein [Staphylococcus aureus subsp. aureus ST22]
MKFGKTIAVVLASSVLLAGCTTDKKEIKAYLKQVDKIKDDEEPIKTVGKKIAELDEKKKKLTEDVNSKDTTVRGKAVKDLIKNADDRLKEFEKEEDAIKKSEQDFKKAKSHVDNIDNDVKRKEVKQLDDVLKEKYKLHSDYAKAYKKAVNSEKTLFKYLNQNDATQQGVNEKSKAIEENYKKLKEVSDKYTKVLNKVGKEKQDVDQFK